MRPINSQMDRAQWSSSIILSTSTVRNTNCERSIDARRGGDDVFTLAVYSRSRQRNSSSVDAKANFFTASRRNNHQQQPRGARGDPIRDRRGNPQSALWWLFRLD